MRKRETPIWPSHKARKSRRRRPRPRQPVWLTKDIARDPYDALARDLIRRGLAGKSILDQL